MYYINGVCDMLQHCDCLRYFNVIYVRLISSCRRGKQAFSYEEVKEYINTRTANTRPNKAWEIRHSLRIVLAFSLHDINICKLNQTVKSNSYSNGLYYEGLCLLKLFLLYCINQSG